MRLRHSPMAPFEAMLLVQKEKEKRVSRWRKRTRKDANWGDSSPRLEVAFFFFF